MPPNSTGVIPEYLTNQTDILGIAINRSFSPASALARITNNPDAGTGTGTGTDNDMDTANTNSTDTANGMIVQCGPTAAPVELPPPVGGFAFDAVVLEEDMRHANQRIAGYTLEICTKVGGSCSENEWVGITGNVGGNQTVTLGVTVGRKVIERGFDGTDGLTIHATGLRFRCTAAFPAGTTTAYVNIDDSSTSFFWLTRGH